MRKTGHYEQPGGVKYFIPDPLPPQSPSFELGTESSLLYGQTMHAIGELNGASQQIPDIQRFIKAYTMKEALLSSAIEGIHTTLLEVFTQPLLDTKPSKDTQLVLNYQNALEAALYMMQQQGMPITSRVLLKAHAALLEKGENDKADPGSFRKQAVRVGNLTPPPAQEIQRLMGELEKYINTDTALPALIQAGLAHVQFETIHPFLDGNGRIGRLLILLMLLDDGLIQKPILYPSYYFKKNQLEYYERLDRVRTHGDFEGWITFYLKIMRSSALDALKRAQEITALREDIIALLPRRRSGDVPCQTLNILFSTPIINATELARQLDVAYNTAQKIITDLVEVKVLVELGNQKRNKLYKFQPYFELLEKEYDL